VVFDECEGRTWSQLSRGFIKKRFFAGFMIKM
jgi:hypothetical protein